MKIYRCVKNNDENKELINLNKGKYCIDDDDDH